MAIPSLNSGSPVDPAAENRNSIPVTSEATVHPDLPSLFLLSFFSLRRCENVPSVAQQDASAPVLPAVCADLHFTVPELGFLVVVVVVVVVV